MRLCSSSAEKNMQVYSGTPLMRTLSGPGEVSCVLISGVNFRPLKRGSTVCGMGNDN